jgi:hypothetical protein
MYVCSRLEPKGCVVREKYEGVLKPDFGSILRSWQDDAAPERVVEEIGIQDFKRCLWKSMAGIKF